MRQKLIIILISLSLLPFVIAMEEEDSESVPVYRLDMLLTTTSDWTDVYFTNIDVYGEEIISVEPEEMEGTLRVGFFSVSKNAYDGSPVEVLYRVSIPCRYRSTTNIEVKILKGDIGRTTIEFRRPGSDKVLAYIENSMNVKGDPENKVSGYVDMSILQGGKRKNICISKREYPPLVLAFYYPWYGSPQGEHKRWVHWDPNKKGMASANTPLLGYYDSYSKEVIKKHTEWAKDAGIDGFIVSFWGIAHDDEVMKKILEVAEEEDFLVSIYYEPDRNIKEIKADLKYIFENYCKSEQFVKIDGLPLIFFYNRCIVSMNLTQWERLFSDLRREGIRFFSIVDDLSGSLLNAFDGVHRYNPVKLGMDRIGWIYHRARLFTSVNGKVFCATVLPGYDDRNIRKKGFYISRDYGRFYRAFWEMALGSDPDIILITSFNEWHEGTEIEPSVEYGDKYIKMTSYYSEKFKKIVH
ncbi:MAG: hypothetical protein DRH49_01140 [Candidatus Coatesbacteria bacterium]|nr:MAG: hypothetical protein DRH49_01140 [Candidatus Coatesbacteria bacterium]